MKPWILVLAAGLLAGCATQQGGLIGTVQTLDDQLAAKYGVPAEAVAKVRQTLGIIDVRKLPSDDRVLPEGYTWARDILDESNRVVVVHYGPPRIVQSGTAAVVPVTTLDATNAPALDSLDAVIRALAPILKANPALLEEGK